MNCCGTVYRSFPFLSPNLWHQNIVLLAILGMRGKYWYRSVFHMRFACIFVHCAYIQQNLHSSGMERVAIRAVAALIFTSESSYCFQRVLAIAVLSVRPSVCLSVCPSDRHTGDHEIGPRLDLGAMLLPFVIQIENLVFVY